MPSDKAPGLNGFIGIFFKECWDIIKDDVVAAFHQLHGMNGSHFKMLNSTTIVLIPMKLEATHACPLPKQFGVQIPECLHQKENTARRLHRLKKKPALFLKLDIQKAFDTLNWGYLLETLQTMVKLRTSLYADDAAIFLNPVREELSAIKEILHAFGKASGLVTNFEKSSIHPIRFDEPLIEKIGNRLAGWKRHLLNSAGQLILVCSVLSSMPTYHLSIFPLTAWARKHIDRIRRSFLWKGKAETNGGHCLVRWPLVNKPKDLDSLGVLNLDKFDHALRLRWLLQDWVGEDQPWLGLNVPYDRTDRLLFGASTSVSVDWMERPQGI
ncbi:hypothetical protein U9M48_032298 [Paspalum notatum var. saurae]|uniref:Reverse transcriptase domain-containing protein n=1 Tax=Paspalum notatum var. saurae TaxID=547442 RepID=A0AAQ3X5A8_PASNO